MTREYITNAIREALAHGPMCGRELRADLVERGVNQPAIRFYSDMKECVDAGICEMWIKETIVDEWSINQYWFGLTKTEGTG